MLPTDEMPELIIDSHFLAHQARHVNRGLSHGDQETGVIFGFLSRILTIGELFKTNRFLFCWDSKHSYRRKSFPGYKKRNYTDAEIEDLKEMKRQIIRLRRQILPTIGFKNQFLQPGCEADDLVASIVDNKIGRWIIISADQDLYQLLRSNCRMYNPSSNKMMTRKRFKEEYGIKVAKWVRVKAIAGCTSDTIPGITGVGEKNAIKYLLGELNQGKRKDAILAGKDIIARNMKLVQLPIPETKEPEVQYDSFSLAGFIEICEQYGLSSFLEEKKMDQWSNFFVGAGQKREQRKPKRKRDD